MNSASSFRVEAMAKQGLEERAKRQKHTVKKAIFFPDYDSLYLACSQALLVQLLRKQLASPFNLHEYSERSQDLLVSLGYFMPTTMC